MSASNLEDFLILRELDEPVTTDDLDAVDVRSTEVRSELRADGVEIWAIQSEVMQDEHGAVTGTHCHYRAESEESVREHASRAGLPVTRLDRRGQPVAGDEA